jgi:hypothetical protein
MRLATPDDKDFIIERARANGQLWSDSWAEELLTEPHYIVIIDEEGVFYLDYDEKTRNAHCGLHVGFEKGDQVRYMALWKFAFKVGTAKWPDWRTADMLTHPTACFAPNVVAVADRIDGLEIVGRKGDWNRKSVPRARLAAWLGVRDTAALK